MSNEQATVELWKEVPGFEKFYKVSNHGRVKSLDRLVEMRPRNRGIYWAIREGRILAAALDGYGYFKVVFSINKVKTTHTVHKLVATVFVPNPENKPEVNHKDGDKTNNNDWNLEWCTKQENHVHATENNLKAKGSSHGKVKLTDEQVLNLRAEYKGRSKGPTMKQLGEKYGIKEAQTCAIINRKNWTHI